MSASSEKGPKDVPDPVPAPRLLIGVALGPAAWITQLTLCYGVAAYACFSGDAPRPGAATEAPPWEFGLLLAANLACLVVAAAGVALSADALHKAETPAPGGEESLPAITRRRIQFVAACGVMAGLGAMLAILFDAPQIFLTPACWALNS